MRYLCLTVTWICLSFAAALGLSVQVPQDSRDLLQGQVILTDGCKSSPPMPVFEISGLTIVVT